MALSVCMAAGYMLELHHFLSAIVSKPAAAGRMSEAQFLGITLIVCKALVAAAAICTGSGLLRLGSAAGTLLQGAAALALYVTPLILVMPPMVSGQHSKVRTISRMGMRCFEGCILDCDCPPTTSSDAASDLC